MLSSVVHELKQASSLAWYAEFLLEINLKVLLRKTGARLIFKIVFMSLHIESEEWHRAVSPGVDFIKQFMP